MSVPFNDLDARMELFSDGLKRAGIKLTHQRIEIFREVASSTEHPDAETIYNGVRKRITTVSLDTVYRTLWLLLDLGLIATVGPPRDRARFDGDMRPHHHFVCTRCGRTYDFHSDGLDRLPIPDDVRDIGSIERAHVEVRGVCVQCSSIEEAT